jgi:hypothetical protein
MAKKKQGPGEPGPANEPYEKRSGRNYDLFAILADVRNWRGFAGVDRGLPEDVTLADLLAFPRFR